LTLGSESAIEGALAEESGGRIVLVESEGSKVVAIMIFSVLDDCNSKSCDDAQVVWQWKRAGSC
jgi:hypothetical protein